MQQTLSSLRTLQADFLQELKNFRGEMPIAADQNRQLNYALQIIGRRISIYDPKVVLTLTADHASYNVRDLAVVSKRIVKVFQVVINGNLLWDASHGDYGLWTLTELERVNPSWRTDPSGTPYVAVYTGNGNMLLYQAPTSAVVSAGNNFISGTVMPADLSADNDIPGILEECHEAIAYLAAVYAARPTTSDVSAWQTLGEYNKAWLDIINEIGMENKESVLSWGTTYGTDEPDWMII